MISFEVQNISDDQLDQLIERCMPLILRRLTETKPWKQNLYIPSPNVISVVNDQPFMSYSTCSSVDFFHPRFKMLSGFIGLPLEFHRKFWEWVFVTHHLLEANAVGPNKRGIVFGVGTESLPAVFANIGSEITATDAPREIGVGSGWQDSNEFASEISSLPSGSMNREDFEKLVVWRECNMNAIDPNFVDYDFCWSSCCLEHLGSLENGLEFILNSVENVLKVGGTAVHTTEFNLSSNEDTLEDGPTVLYRRRDLEAFVDKLRARGHYVNDFRIAPDSLVVDGYVDSPPFSSPALKLKLANYTSTSVGLVIKRGR